MYNLPFWKRKFTATQKPTQHHICHKQYLGAQVNNRFKISLSLDERCFMYVVIYSYFNVHLKFQNGGYLYVFHGQNFLGLVHIMLIIYI